MNNNQDRLLKSKEVREILSISTRCLWRWVAEGKLPRPIHMGYRVRRWWASEIYASLKTIQAAKRTK